MLERSAWRVPTSPRLAHGLIDYIVAKRTDRKWADLTDEAQQRLLRHHVALCEEGLTGDREAAADSALALAAREASLHHYAEAIRLGQRSNDALSQGPTTA